VGLGLAAALAGSSVLETLTVNLYFHQLFRICLHLKVTILQRTAPPYRTVPLCAIFAVLRRIAGRFMRGDCVAAWPGKRLARRSSMKSS
jgi:hypothetical protein